jgi:hypothetical protein
MMRSKSFMPIERGVGGRGGGDFLQRLAAQCLSIGAEAAALIIVKQDAFFPGLLLEDSGFSPPLPDNILFVAADSVREGEREQLLGVAGRVCYLSECRAKT